MNRPPTSGRFTPKPVRGNPPSSMSEPDFGVRWDRRTNIIAHPVFRLVEWIILGAAVFGAAALLARYGVGVVR